ncbi:MAG: DUF432 domain-containing protein [Candidatus Natronoplasma sp.]
MTDIYGTHAVPFEFIKDELTLKATLENQQINYTRELGEDIVEKPVIAKDTRMTIQPVEPLNLPKDITSSLLIDFENPIIIDADVKKDIFVTFPIEIAVFLESVSADKPLDLFTMAKQKFTLYGDVKTGTICKYWSTQHSTTIPEDLDPLREGIMALTLINRTKEWKEITNVVFDAYGMKIYYDDERVGMKGAMFIKEEDLSETGFSNKPIVENMTKAREIYKKKKSPIKGGINFVMESGI